MVDFIQYLEGQENRPRKLEGAHPLPERAEFVPALPAGQPDEAVLVVRRTKQGATSGPRLRGTDTECPFVPPGGKIRFAVGVEAPAINHANHRVEYRCGPSGPITYSAHRRSSAWPTRLESQFLEYGHSE